MGVKKSKAGGKEAPARFGTCWETLPRAKLWPQLPGGARGMGDRGVPPLSGGGSIPSVPVLVPRGSPTSEGVALGTPAWGRGGGNVPKPGRRGAGCSRVLGGGGGREEKKDRNGQKGLFWKAWIAQRGAAGRGHPPWAPQCPVELRGGGVVCNKTHTRHRAWGGGQLTQHGPHTPHRAL